MTVEEAKRQLLEAFQAFHPADELRAELSLAAGHAKDDAMRLVRQTKDEVFRTAQQSKDQAFSFLRGAKDDAAELAIETKDELAGAVRSAADHTVAWFRAHPWAITGVALAAGLAVTRAPRLRGRFAPLLAAVAPQLIRHLPRPWSQISQAVSDVVSSRPARTPLIPNRPPVEAPV